MTPRDAARRFVELVLRTTFDDRSPATINRYRSLLSHMFTWAVERGYLERNPFRDGARLLIKAEREDNKRHRRVSPELEAKLLEAAAPHLRLMIIAALDTGMRQGEMLALTWADVDDRPGWLRLRGATTKSGKTRWVPIGTIRMRGLLDFLRIDAAGHSKPSDARVFSNEAGEPIQGFRTAWDAAVLRAHGHQPTRSAKDGKGRLTVECREALRAIDLRWHDLRHEHASRLVELGVPLSQVRDLLGHASITTTERSTISGLTRWKRRSNASILVKVSRIFQVPRFRQAQQTRCARSKTTRTYWI